MATLKFLKSNNTELTMTLSYSISSVNKNKTLFFFKRGQWHENLLKTLKLGWGEDYWISGKAHLSELLAPFIVFKLFLNIVKLQNGRPGWLSGKESACQCLQPVLAHTGLTGAILCFARHFPEATASHHPGRWESKKIPGRKKNLSGGFSNTCGSQMSSAVSRGMQSRHVLNG